MAKAIANLRPHAGESEDLVDVIEALGDVAGEGDGGESLAKALLELRAAKVTLAKSEAASSAGALDAAARLRKAESNLSVEHPSRQPGAWSETSARERLEAIRKAEGGLRAAA